MQQHSFLWHDYETSGTDPFRDRIWQFAGQRTDADLNPLDEPVCLYGKPSHDNLPQPQACLVTGITPQQAERDGVIEAELSAAIHEQLALPGTCGVGYNSLRFDDNFTRNLLYRNFHDPYAREWQNGNSRWDIIDLARMAHALRPHGIEWPQREDGAPSFKLEDLATANHLEQPYAHDAVSDVLATIDLARLLKQRQPKLWSWYLALRKKRRVNDLLDVANRTPLLHVSSRYPAEHGCLTVIAPLARHPSIGNQVIVYDLASDPTELISLDADDLADRIFTPRADLPEGVERIPLRTIHVNQSPALAPLSVLKDVDTARLKLDLDTCLRNAKRVQAIPELASKAREVYAAQTSPADDVDPELAIYAGFLPDADKRKLDEVRATPPQQLAAADIRFRDPRYATLLFRYRARNWPATLSSEEAARWRDFARRRLQDDTDATSLSLTDYFATLHTLRHEQPDAAGLLDQLEAWGLQLAREHDIPIEDAS